MPMVLTTLAKGRLRLSPRLSPRLMLMLLFSMVPMDTAVSAMLDMLALVMLDMLAILMPMVPTPMPMVLTTLERGRLRLNPRLMPMLLFSMAPMVMLLLMLDTVPMLDTPMPMVPTPTPMVATVPTWDKKFSFPLVLLNSITIAYQTIYLRKRSKTSPNDCHPDLPHNQ